MISWTRTVVATGATTDAMGANPNGYISYHADGRMMALVVDRQKHKYRAGVSLADQEKVALFDSMLAYSATYELLDDRVIHRVDASWTPTWGPELVRPFTLKGDTLAISGAPGIDPVNGEEVIYRMEFQRLPQLN
jgi:Lipocalin-like domain